MSSEENEFLIPFSESRKGREPDLEEKALGRRLASYVSSRLVDRPNIGRNRNRRDRGDLDIPTGGKPGTRRPTGSRRDPDNDGWADEGSTNPVWVGVGGRDKKPEAVSASRPPDDRSLSSGQSERQFFDNDPDAKLSSGVAYEALVDRAPQLTNRQRGGLSAFLDIIGDDELRELLMRSVRDPSSDKNPTGPGSFNEAATQGDLLSAKIRPALQKAVTDSFSGTFSLDQDVIVDTPNGEINFGKEMEVVATWVYTDIAHPSPLLIQEEQEIYFTGPFQPKPYSGILEAEIQIEIRPKNKKAAEQLINADWFNGKDDILSGGGADGVIFGASDRRLRFNGQDIEIEHASLQVPNLVQGRGIGSAFNARNERIYNAMGAKRIISTGVSDHFGRVGASHWLRNGFTFAGQKDQNRVLRLLRDPARRLNIPEWHRALLDDAIVDNSINEPGAETRLILNSKVPFEVLLAFPGVDELFAKENVRVNLVRDLGAAKARSPKGASFSSGESAPPANRPTDGLLNTLRNFHDFYGLRHRSEDRMLDSEGQAIPRGVFGDGIGFSSGASFDAEVERRQLSDARQNIAEDISYEIRNKVLPAISWTSGPLIPSQDARSRTLDRVDIDEFVSDFENGRIVVDAIASLFGSWDVDDDGDTAIIEMDRDMTYIDPDSGDTVNLGNIVTMRVSHGDVDVRRAPSQLATIQNIDSGADLSTHGDYLRYSFEVVLSAPESVRRRLQDAGYDVGYFGHLNFSVRVNNTGTSVYVDELRIDSEYKNLGLARAVMAYSENAWKTMGANAIYLTGKSGLSARQADRRRNGEDLSLDKLEYTGASYWPLNGYDWDGAEARDKMLRDLYWQLKAESNGTADKTYFSQSDRERLLSQFTTEDDGYIYASFKTAEELMQSADKEALSRFFAEGIENISPATGSNGFGIEIRYKRVIDPDAHKASQDERLALALRNVGKPTVDQWNASPNNSRAAANASRIPLSISDAFLSERPRRFLAANITWLENIARNNEVKFYSGENTSMSVERYGNDAPFDVPVGFTVGDRKFTISTGGDSPGRDMYNGYIAAFDDKGNLAGYLDYNSESQGNTATIAMIEVNENFRRMGIGSALLDALRITMPDYEISPGYTTDDGSNWWKEATGGPGPIKGPRRGARINIDDRRDNAGSSTSLSSGLSDAPASVDDKYRGVHLAPDRTNGAPMYNMTDGVYPENLYGVNGAEYYGLGDPRANEAMSILRRVHNKPDAMVTVYRAVPLLPDEQIRELEKQQRHILQHGRVPRGVNSSGYDNVSDYYNAISREIEMLRNAKHSGKRTQINAGDWVTPIRSYAREHGQSNLGGAGRYRIVQKRVKAQHLFTEGNSLLEFGYDPDDNPHRLSSGEHKPPRFPREPSYGPYLGDAETIFGDARTWRELRSAIAGRDIIFVDYETTGLVTDEFWEPHGNGKPVQIALIKMRDGRVVDELNLFMNPGEPLGDWSSKNLFRTDGEQLTDDWLKDQMSIADAHRMVADFAGPDALFGVQNARFDKNVLEDALSEAGISWRPSGYLDTMDIAAMVLPRYTDESPDGPYIEKDGVKVPSSSLKAITKYLGVQLEKHHSAEHDALAAGMALFAMINQAEDRGWDSRILDRARRLDFLDRRTEQFEQSLRDFSDKKRIFLEAQSSTDGRLSSGGSDRPIIPIAPTRPTTATQTGDRQRPRIQVQVMDRDTREKLTRHRARNYKYGDISELGQPITVNAVRPLYGLTSQQIANVIVPDSEETYLKMLADSYAPIGMPMSDMDRALRLTALRGEYEIRKQKYGVGIDFSPEAVDQMRRIVSASLDAVPALKWGMETFGAPPIVKLTTPPKSVSERTAGLYMVELNTIGVTPRYLNKITSTGEFAGQPPLEMSMQSPNLDVRTISNSISGIVAHEWGHYLHFSLMAHAQSPYNQHYKVEDVGPFLSGIQHGLGDASSPLRIRAMQVAEKYFKDNWEIKYDESVRPFRRISPETPNERFDREYELHKQSGQAFGDLWKTDPQPLVRGKYGSTDPLEAIAEAAAAILHPDPQFKEIALNDTLRSDFFALLGLEDRATPWEAMIERDRALSSGSVGSGLRSAHRERLDVARRDMRDLTDRKLSSGMGMQSRIDSDESRTDAEKLLMMARARGIAKTGPVSSMEMELLGPRRRFLRIRDDQRFSSGGAEQTLFPGAYKGSPQKSVISKPYSGKFGPDSEFEASAEIHQIGDEKILFGYFGDAVLKSINADYTKIVPLNPYIISGFSPDSEDGRAIALQWVYARAANDPDRSNPASTYVDALLYAASRGDSDAQAKFDELAAKGQQLVEDAKPEALGMTDKYKEDGIRARSIAEATSQQILDYGIDDLYLVHETKWDIQTDDDGNVILRPAADYGLSVGEDGTTFEHYRQTIHFTINHLALGHSERPGHEQSNIIITPLRSVLEANPGALENLFAIDTWLVPKPGEPLTLPGAVVIRKDGTNKHSEEIDAFFKERGSKIFDPGVEAGSGTNFGQDYIVHNIAESLGVSGYMHYTHTSRDIERQVVSEFDSSPVPSGVLQLAQLSDNHKIRFSDTTSRFKAYTEREVGVFSSGSSRRIDEITGRTFGGVPVAPGSRPKLRRTPQRSGISQRERDSFAIRRASLSSGESDGIERIGTVSARAIATVRGKRFNYDELRDRFDEQATDIPVHDINGQQIAFTRDVVDAPGVKRLPINPYVITNTSPISDEGRQYARLWFMATVAKLREDRKDLSSTSALLYAAARGDSAAARELNRLAAAGEALIREGKKKSSELPQRRLGGTKFPSERTPDWWKSNYPGVMIRVAGKDGDYSRDTRLLDVQDLFVVHQTPYKPTIDADGNLILRPTGDFDVIDPATGAPFMSPFNDQPVKRSRQTVHFALNHLVSGHIYRQPPITENYAIVIPLKSLMDANPGSVDNIYSVDTFLTPKPGEGLKLPKGSFKIVSLPSVKDHTGIDEPRLSYAERSREDQDIWSDAVGRTTKHHEGLVEQALAEIGKEFSGDAEYRTRIIPGGDDGSTSELDTRISDIAHELGVMSQMHSSTFLSSDEEVTPFTRPDLASLDRFYYDIENLGDRDGTGYITRPNSPLEQLSDNAILRILDTDRYTTSADFYEKVDENENFLARPTSPDDDDDAFESGGGTGVVSADAARLMLLNTSDKPQKIEIDESWLRDGFDIGWLRDKYPDMHFAPSVRPWDRGLYVPYTGTLADSASVYDKWQDSQAMAGYLRRSYWHPGIVDPSSELGSVMQLWRSDFAESRALTRALSGLDIPLAFADRGPEFDRNVQTLRTGIDSAPELGFTTYRTARLTEDIGARANVGDELTFNAAAVAAGVNTAAEYDRDELSALPNMPQKFMFEFPPDTRGLLFDEQGLAMLDKPHASGADSGPVEGIVSGRFRVASIKKVNVRDPYSRKDRERDVIVLEKLSSGTTQSDAGGISKFIDTTDDGIVVFRPGVRRNNSNARPLRGGGAVMTSQALRDEAVSDATLLPQFPKSTRHWESAIWAKNFVTGNIASSLKMPALDIVGLFADRGEDTPSGIIIRNLALFGEDAEYFTSRAKSMQWVPDGGNFMAAWVVRDDVQAGGSGAFIRITSTTSTDASQTISTDKDMVQQMQALTLDRRRALHAAYVQPMIDRGFGVLVRDLMTDRNLVGASEGRWASEYLPPDAPDDRRFIIRPLSVRFNEAVDRVASAIADASRQLEIREFYGPDNRNRYAALFLALGGRLDADGKLSGESKELLSRLHQLKSEFTSVFNMIYTHIEGAFADLDLDWWTGTPNIRSRWLINRKDIREALAQIGPSGRLPHSGRSNMQRLFDGNVPLKTGSNSSWQNEMAQENAPATLGAMIAHTSFVPDEAFRDEWFGGQLIDKNHPQFDTILKQAIVSDLVKTWAISANDANPVALAIQNVARRIFGSDGATGWKLEFNSEYGPPDSRGLAFSSLNEYEREIALDDKLNNGSRKFDASPELSPGQEQFFTELLTAMHTATQEYYKSKGVTHVPIYRGVSLTPEEAGYDVAKQGPNENYQLRNISPALAEQLANNRSGIAIWTDDVVMRPISSWSVNPYVAANFAATGLGTSPGKTPHLMFTLIPIENILCNPFTGFGCLDEDEVVVIGKPVKTLIGQFIDGPASAGTNFELPSSIVRDELRDIEWELTNGKLDWREFKVPKNMPDVEVRGNTVPRRDQVGGQKLSSGGMPEYIKNPTARLIAGLGKTEGIKSVDADMRKPTADLDVAKKEGRPISWLLNETIDPELGEIVGEMVDSLLADKKLREYFNNNQIHPFAMGSDAVGRGRMDGSGSDHTRIYTVGMIKLEATLQIKYPELTNSGSGDTTHEIAVGLMQRAGIIAMRSLWAEREAKKLNIRVDELIDKMINQTRRLEDYDIQASDEDREFDSIVGNMKRGINDIDRVVVALDGRAMYGLINDPEDKRRILSQFEAKRSNGAYSLSQRRAQEVAMFGYHPEMEPSKRPIYGFAAYGGISEELDTIGYQYGEYLVVLKPEVADRTTVTEVDSLSTVASSSAMRSPGMGMRTMLDQYGKDGVSTATDYIEAQIHSVDGKNGVSLDDIAYVLLRDDDEATDDELAEMQEKLGIPFRRFSEEIQNGYSSDFDGLAYIDESDLG